MLGQTREFFNAWLNNVAKAYGASPMMVQMGKQFSATPQIEQALKKDLMNRSGLMSKINARFVTQISGKKVGLSANQSIASTTDTANGGTRTAKAVKSLDSDEYKCEKTNFDTAIDYDTLDDWSEFPEFQAMLQGIINDVIANNKILVGWYGEGRAADSDPVANPLLQDVNKGWFQKIRDHAPSQMLSEGGTAGEIRFGEGGDFENLDHLVMDLVQGIHLSKRQNPNLRVLIGQELLDAQGIKLYQNLGTTPSEKMLMDMPKVNREFGGVQLETDATFPGRGVMVTDLKNLGHYTQRGSVRRTIKDNAEKDRIENFLSMRDAYVIEENQAVAAIEFKNVKLFDGTNWI